MPLHGKVVVIKRSGGDGTEFPLTASCLFGRKPDCDIRIQLPQVSKEHCRIDLNENKEVILTNLSSVNPTCVNGQALQQSERLKHGDVITIIDRSFRFEYPPAPTPKKRSSVGGKAEAVASDPHLKDGANSDNIQRSLEKTLELESKEDVSLSKSKTASPFNELYQMIKKSLDVKTPRKSSVSILQTPSSKFCTPKPESTRKDNTKPDAVGGKSTPKKAQTPVRAAEKVQTEDGSTTPRSAKKRHSLQLHTEQTPAQETTQAETTSPRRKATPQKLTVSEAVAQIATQSPKSPLRRRSKENTSPKSETKQAASPAKTDNTRKATPKSSETAKEKSKKRKSEELAADLPTQQMKRKRVSFGGHLSPELFDKRLPPDSPLRKGAAPRRSLCLSRPKQSLLRRASVIGLLKECDQQGKLVKSPKAKSPAKTRTPSPKKSPSAKNASPKTPTSAKKSPKSPKAQSPAQKATSPKAQSPKNKSPSPKTPSPGKKAATPKSASPKTASPKSVKTPVKSPQTPKATPQRKSTPKTKSPARVTPVKTPLPSGDQTPTVQGRFSVSRISTPSPVAENTVTEHVSSVSVTPKIPLQRKSMKSSAKKTPALKSATKVMRRKSGLMRSSMKVMTSWADIVRFGKAKVQVAVPTKKQVTKKMTKKQILKTPKKMLQTPVRKLVDHVSTGHAASPATIVVGRAHRLRVVQATGAPPKIITNTAVLTKNRKMDEDLTGITEMFKTPKNDKRRSVKAERSAAKTPLADVSKSIIEPSVLNTPEETGEMVVSPMSVASTVKGRRYNCEAVQRLLDEQQESSFVSDIPSLEIESEPTEQETTEMKVDSSTTPKHKIEKPEGLTGVKRIMKTPKQKAETIEDLRGKLLKTPKQKMEQEECLSAVKRIMKTPKEKGTPVEDLRSKLLKTPKQKIEQQEECLSGVKMMMQTPNQQKLEQPESLTRVKRVMTTPRPKSEPVEDLRGKLLKTPKQKIEQQECLTGVKRVMKTPKEKSEPIDDIRGKLLQTPKQKIEQTECLTGVKRIMTTPIQKTEEEVNTEEIVPATKRIQRTPKEKAQPVEDKFGIKKLMRSPRLRGNAPVEDFEGLEELMKEQSVEDQTCVSSEESVADQSDSTSNDMDAVETIPEPVAEEQPEVLMLILSDSETKPVTVSVEEEKQEEVAEVPVRGRRGRKMEPVQDETAPEPAVKPRRGRVNKKAEVQAVPSEITTVPEPESAIDNVEESTQPEEPVVKPQRGRKAKAVELEEVIATPVSDSTPDDEAKESTETVPSVNQEDKSNAMETCEPVVAETVPEVETVAATQIIEAQKKPVRGRRKAVEAKAAHEIKEDVPAAIQDKKEEVSEEAAPVRGRRGKRAAVKEPEQPVQEDSAPEPVVKPRRGRVTKKSSQEKDEVQEVHTDNTTVSQAESSVVESAPSEEHVVKPRRGRIVKKDVVQALPTETMTESESAANNGVEESAPAQEPAVKPRRGRKAKAAEPELVTPAPVSDATQDEEAKESTETIPSVQEEESVSVEPVIAESAPEVETVEPCIQEPQKKPARGRKKAVETKTAHEEKEDVPAAVEDKKDEEIPEEAAPVRGRRGKRADAPVAPAGRQRRGRAGKTQEINSDEAAKTPLEETNQVNETAPEAPDNHTTAANDTEHNEEAAKPKRGRNNKKPAEPKPEPESVVTEGVVEDIQTIEETQSEPPVKAEKPKRGRHARAATEVPQAPVRGKRGCAAKLEDQEKPVPEQQSETKSPKKVRGSKKAELHQDEPSEAVQTTEAAEETPVEAVKDEQAPKSRRGAQKTRDAQNGASEEISEEVPVSSSTDKPKRGKRGKQVSEESTSAEVTEQIPEDNSANVKPSRARGKTSAKHVPDTVLVKRARRGAAVPTEDSTVDATEEVTQLAPVQPVKKGRRAATKAPAEETVSSTHNTSTEESNAVEDASKRSVQWKTDVQIFEVTPAKKTARGRKTKSGDQTETENAVPQKATNLEEKDLSDTEVQPAKRARRGAKAADVSTKTNVDNTEAETQPKTRRGRAAKK